MGLKIIITGTTGMVGKGVLLECLNNNKISEILSISRTPLGFVHPKLKEMIHENFYDFSQEAQNLEGYDGCFFCLGTTSAGKSEENYTKITYDLTIGFAKVLVKASPQATFCYVSGEGTDSTENGKTMWARVKGKTENDLLNMGFKDAYMFRPGFIKAMHGVKSKTKLYAFFYSLFSPLIPLIMLSAKFATNTDKIAKVMIGVTEKGYSKKILNTAEINLAAIFFLNHYGE